MVGPQSIPSGRFQQALITFYRTGVLLLGVMGEKQRSHRLKPDIAERCFPFCSKHLSLRYCVLSIRQILHLKSDPLSSLVQGSNTDSHLQDQ